jgi:hypothetical protein
LRHSRINDAHVADTLERNIQFLLTRQQLQIDGAPGFNIPTQA